VPELQYEFRVLERVYEKAGTAGAVALPQTLLGASPSFLMLWQTGQKLTVLRKF